MIPYEFTSSSDKKLRKLSLNIQRQIIKKIEFFLGSPKPLYFAEPLVGRKQVAYRYRINDYRVIFELAEGKVTIIDIGKRDSIYE